eukprot:CAMPEP_0202737292 /NCGR_PEP_ID=MMETSP1388-20130828/1491_1 /ASSEMBLY_ACC=CAM_ASM_000864 /TAXON_ID=37098 /ORGANISM="Isochrysis sp, Strain CCMP1244" /LENGTH=229 /DNA_ID=CAMNT_0049403839 /DNA_START=22 /DNA_END=711 /DNA_ORIENTATION=+
MTLARASSEVSEVSEPRDEEAGQSFRLLENSLALARRQLAVQTSLLGDAQQRVEMLVGQQQQLVGAAPAHAADSTAADAAPVLARADATMVDSDTKVARLRELLGAAVRARSEQASELASLRADLSAERSAAGSLRAQRRRELAQLQEAELRVEQLSEELGALRADSQERVRVLEGRIADMEEAEQKRVALEEALAAAGPPPDAPPVAVIAAPATAAADSGVPPGGFEL